MTASRAYGNNANRYPAVRPYNVEYAAPRNAGLDLTLESTVEMLKTIRDFLNGRLEMGFRSSRFSLDTRRLPNGEHFIGTINELAAVQDSSWDFYFAVFPIRNLGIEYTTEKTRARTFTLSDDNHSDGDVLVKGKVFSVVLRLPIEQLLQLTHEHLQWPRQLESTAAGIAARFTPYVGFGLTRDWSGAFLHAPWWQYGYPSPQDYEDAGSPRRPRAGYTREMRVEDPELDADVFTIGISVHLWEGVTVDLSRRDVSVSPVRADYYRWGRYTGQSAAFPMDYSSTAIALKYAF